MWARIIADDGSVHVVPILDLGVHNISGFSPCACHCTVEIQTNGRAVVTHKSWDGREFVERAKAAIIYN